MHHLGPYPFRMVVVPWWQIHTPIPLEAIMMSRYTGWRAKIDKGGGGDGLWSMYV